MCRELILSWQDMKSREWFPVGRLSFSNNTYEFGYTNGAFNAEQTGFLGLAGMNDFFKSYKSENIFPVFQNRILNKSRPDRPEFLNWLDINLESYSQFEELARTGGIKATDSLRLYPVPSAINGKYLVNFFAHGVSHLIESYKKRANDLSVGDKLYLCADLENEYDKNALILRTQDPVEVVGYCPKFFAEDFYKVFEASKKSFNIDLVRVNIDAPEQLRLLCKLSCEWPNNFLPFNKPEFQLISTHVNPIKQPAYTSES